MTAVILTDMDSALGWREGVSSIALGYLIPALIATLTILFTAAHSAHARRQPAYYEKIDKIDKMVRETGGVPLKRDSDDESELCTDSVQAKYKSIRQKVMFDKMSEKLTPEQLVEEKNVEKAQLEAIFNLLKEQQDKFQVTDMEELQQQLNLYR